MSDATSLERTWARFRDLPDEILDTLPAHVITAFRGARQHNFEVELLSANAIAPLGCRSERRLVIVADEGTTCEACGPVNFDLKALAADVASARRVYVISNPDSLTVVAAAYEAAVRDLAGEDGSDVSVIVETTQPFETSWVRALTAMKNGGLAPCGNS